jgi:hypothetical protein
MTCLCFGRHLKPLLPVAFATTGIRSIPSGVAVQLTTQSNTTLIRSLCENQIFKDLMTLAAEDLKIEY